MKTESAMVPVLKKFFEDLHCVTVQEFGVGYGVADLVAYSLSHENCRKRIVNAQKQPLEKLQYFQILEAIPDIEEKKTITLENLSSASGLSQARLKYHWLKSLEELGYVEQLEKYHYAKVNGFIPITQEITAVEAKLSDWKKGAIQAKRYMVFADRTYLAIDERAAHRVDRTLLSRHGIGLLLVSENGAREILSPLRTGPRDHLRYCLAGEAAYSTDSGRLIRGKPAT